MGSDEERSAAPVDSAVRNNLFLTDAQAPVSVFDDISGIKFADNVSSNAAMSDYGSSVASEIVLARAANGLYPVDEALAAVGAPRDLDPIKRADTGPQWFAKPAQSAPEQRVKRVRSGARALQKAVAESQPGDVLELRGKRYKLKAPLEIPHALTIKGRVRNAAKTSLRAACPNLFEIAAGGALTLTDLELVGSNSNAAVIKALGENYEGSYSLALSDVTASAEPGVTNLPFITADNDSFATSIQLKRVSATDWPGTFVALSGAKLDGWYLAEDVGIHDSSFTNLGGPLIEFGREGRDESTFGPRVQMQNSSLSAVNPAGHAIHLKGIDGVAIQNNQIRGSGKIRIKKRVLGLSFDVQDNQIEGTPAPELLGVNDERLAATKAPGSR